MLQLNNYMYYELIIIGFGISGISLAKEAIKNNINFLVLEKNSNLGGVWFNANENTSLQTHRMFYEYTEEEIMETKNDYPNKNEIIDYLNKIIDKYKIKNKVLYNCCVTKIEKRNNLYFINNTYSCKYLGICNGINNIPIKLPDKIVKNFTGNIIHSSELNDKDYYNFNNKNIVIIGNGASACDIISIIEKKNITCTPIVLYRSDKYYVHKYIFKIPISLILCKPILLLFKYLPLIIYYLLIKLTIIFLFNIYLDTPYSKMNGNNLIASNIIQKKISDGTLCYVKDILSDCQNKNLICENNIFLNIDYIILATGYKSDYSFLKEYNISNKLSNQIYDKHLENCAFIGYSKSYNWSQISEKQSKIFINDILKNRNRASFTNYDEKIIKNFLNNQKYNDLDYNDLTYEMFSYK